MGNNPNPNIPQYYSYNEVKNIINELNRFFAINKQFIHINLNLVSSRVNYSNANWRKSIVPGQISTPSIQPSPQQPVIITLQDIYQLHQTLKHLNHRNSIRESLKQSISKQPKTMQSKTPSFISSEDNQCCICCERAPTCALPCSHVFCQICTNKYIIQCQEKKCPICRAVLEGTNQTVAQQVYTVIQEDSEIYQEVRDIVLEIISHNNEEVAKKLGMELKGK